MTLALAIGAPAFGVVYTYENTTTGAIGTVVGGGAANTTCDNGGGATLVRTFTVTDSFNVATIALGLNIDHAERGDLRARLVAPGGSFVQLFVQGADTDDNYDIQIAAIPETLVGGLPLDDGGQAFANVLPGSDPTGEPYYARLVNLAGMNFYSGNSAGTWELRICDRDSFGPSGTFNRAKLILDDGQAAPQVCSSTAEYEWGNNGNNVPFTSATVDDISLTLVSTRDLTSDGANTNFRTNFTTQTGVFGNEAGYFIMQYDDGAVGPQSPEQVLLETTWSFDPPVRYQTWRHLDVDNGSWEDYIRVLAFDSNGAAVPYGLTTVSATHDVAGDIIETDGTNVVDTSTDGNITYTFTRPVATLVVQYMRGDDFNDPGSQRIGIGNPTFCAFDYGDAPNSYGTLLSGGARHVLGTRGLWLGASPPDGESDGQTAGGAATADDINAVGGIDDEDGVSVFAACPNNGTYAVSVTASNSSGSAATLVGYMDWDRSGTFNTGSERSASVNVPNGTSNGVFNVVWSGVPTSCGGTATTFARFRISTDSASVLSPTGQAPDGEVEDYQITNGTLPVTLAWVESSTEGGDLAVRWATVSESNNAGFRVWGLDAKGRRTLLGKMPSEAPDTFAPQHYAARFPAAAGVVAIEIEDVSLIGGNRLHGPFAVGRQAGSEPDEGARIDWRTIREETGIAGPLDAFGSVDASHRPTLIVEAKGKKGGSPAAGASYLGRLLTRETGVHRVTYEQLLTAGIDLTGVAGTQIAVLDRGVGVPRHVEIPGAGFGPGAYVEFVARPSLTLASPVDAYVLAVDPSHAVAAGSATERVGAPGVTRAALVSRPDRVYSYSAPNGDPWFDQRVLAWGGAASLTRTFDLPNLAAGPVRLDLLAWGYGDWPGAAPDHHVRVFVNGTEIADEVFDGVVNFERSVDVTGLVDETSNVLELRVPGDTGYAFDNIAFEGFEIDYARETVAIDGRFEGAVARPFQIDGFVDGERVAVWQVLGGSAVRGLPKAIGGTVSAPGGGGTTYAAQGAGILTPGIVAGVATPELSSNAEYVIVTHPAFAGSVGDLVALRQSRGLTTEVVTVDSIYAAYSDHAASPEAIRSFLNASWNLGHLRYVLIVGSDTVDPYDHLGIGSVSYVPTFYLPYAAYPIFFSATDEYMVDFDGDAVGEVPIGRLPARTPSELEAVIAKIAQWETNVATGSVGALLSAGGSDADRGVADLNEAYALSLAAWSPLVAQVDDLGTSVVRTAVLDAMSTGTPLVSYVGHSSAPRWDFNPILQWQDVAGLGNAGSPNLVTQWGCWNSYYMDPAYESLSAHLLRRIGGGAAGTIGAMTLTTDSAHRTLGNLFFARVGAGAATVGDAFRGAKLDLAAQGWGEDALLGMALLGDPAMSLPNASTLAVRP